MMGVKQGQGTYLFADGSRYKGAWEENHPNGHGVASYSDGSCYDGLWQEGMKHGKGTLFEGDGSVKHGEWRQDRFVRTIDKERQSRSITCKMLSIGQI